MPQFRHFTVADGLASTTVYSMMQDRKGYLWLCTEAGVNRFTGHSFETFNVSNGLADNEHFKCFEDGKGRIWFATYNGKLCYYKDGRCFKEKEDASLHYTTDAGNYLKHFVEDSEGNIWFSTFQGGIFRYDGAKVTAAGRQYLGLLSPMLFLLGGQAHTMIAGPYTNMLYTVASNKAIALKRKRPFTNITDRVENFGGDNATAFITESGIESLKGDSLITNISSAELHGKISCACMVANDLWIGSYRTGVFCIRDYKHKGKSGRQERYLSQASISQIITDMEGGIWISTLSDGVYYLPGSQSYITNIPTPSVTSVQHSARKGRWAAGTYYGQVMIFQNDSLVLGYKNPAYPDTRIKSFSWMDESRLLVGMDYLPYILDVNSMRTIPCQLPASGISDLYAVKEGTLICARSSIYFLDKQGKVKALLRNDGATTPISYKLVSVAGTNAYSCWFTGISSLFHLDSAGVVHEVAGAALLGANPIDLVCTGGQVWVGTHGNGIFIFKDDRLQYHLTEANSQLTSNVCQKLMDDHHGNIWVATNKGISIYDAATRQFKFRLTLDDVLIDNDIKDMDVDAHNAFIATPTGISVINTEKIISRSLPPPVYVTALKANDSSYTGAVHPGFLYFKGELTLEFTAITFQANQSLRYRYRSASGDTAWHETATGQVSFYNLPPGNYDFLIAAKKYNSDWSKPVLYGFTITPRWYQSWWFRAMLGLLVAAVILIVYRLQIASIRRREAEKTAYNKRIAELEGSALANQMNPHFIFNSLNTVQQFILQKEERQVLDYLSDFSVLMRQMLQYSRSALIDLESEVDFLKRYLELEQTRFNGKFTYKIEIDKHLLDEGLKVPPMLIQPLLENAIKHGISNKGGHIMLHIVLVNDVLVVTVSDDGAGIDEVRSRDLPKEKGYESTALKVIESRIRLMSDKQHSTGALLIVDRKSADPLQTGTIATLKIPLAH